MNLTSCYGGHISLPTTTYHGWQILEGFKIIHWKL